MAKQQSRDPQPTDPTRDAQIGRSDRRRSIPGGGETRPGNRGEKRDTGDAS